MKRYTLSVKYERHSGYMGFILDRVRQIENTRMVTDSGEIIAHDIIEHITGLHKIGSIYDELQALGAMYFVRSMPYDSEDIPSKKSRHFLADDLAGFCIEFVEKGIKGSLTTKKHKNKELVKIFSHLVDIAKIALKNYFDVNDNFIDLNADKINHYFENAIHIMCIGYTKAKKKYKTQNNANVLYWSIAHAINMHINENGIDPDQKYELLINYHGVEKDIIFRTY